jgi:hypothetical protein
VKGIAIAVQSFVVFLSTVVVAFAEEAKKEGGGYDAMAGVWYALILIIVVYGVYDSFFKRIE